MKIEKKRRGKRIEEKRGGDEDRMGGDREGEAKRKR